MCKRLRLSQARVPFHGNSCSLSFELLFSYQEFVSNFNNGTKVLKERNLYGLQSPGLGLRRRKEIEDIRERRFNLARKGVKETGFDNWTFWGLGFSPSYLLN